MQASITKLPDYKKIASQIKRSEVKVLPEEIERLKLEKERMETEKVRREILEKIGENSKADIPQDLIERERGLMLESLKQQVAQMFQISFDDYLKKMGKTEKELFDSLMPEAKKRIMSFMVLGAIAEKENIQVSDEEIGREAEIMGKNFPNAAIDQTQLREYTKNIIRNEKVFQLLENI